MGENEFGRCDICGKYTSLYHKYYYYDIKCECCSPKHFVYIVHCKDCIPKPPKEIKVVLKSKDYFVGEEE